MPQVVAFAGGSGGLGRAFIEAVKADSRYEPLILAREAKPRLEEETGVRVLVADYSNIEALSKLLEDNKVETVVSTINGQMDTTPELNLVQAADRSKVTRRYIPNIWSGIVYRPEHVELVPMAAPQFVTKDALAKTKLEWTVVYPGIFLDYYAPGIPSHITRSAIAIDVVNNVAGIGGDGEYPVHFTHSFDIGKYVIALLGLDKWDNIYFIAGDTKTWNELLKLAESIKGVNFDVTYDSIEKLRRGEATELPAHRAAYQYFGGEANKHMVIAIMARFQLLNALREGQYGGGAFLNEIFPAIKPLSLKEALEKSFPAK